MGDKQSGRVMRPLGRIEPCASTTDAVFQVHQIKNDPAKATVRDPMRVPQDGDSLFVSVLHAMKTVNGDDALTSGNVRKLMRERLASMAVEHQLLTAGQQGDAPNLRWSSSTGHLRLVANTAVTKDATRLRRIVAAHVHAHFTDYYRQHMQSSKAELYKPYTEGVIGWTAEASEEETTRWRKVAQQMVELASTSAPIRDALVAALKYQLEGNDECAEECLAWLGAFFENPKNVRHEIRDALVTTIATPQAGTPTLVLNALADILGVYIDLYQMKLFPTGERAVCVESYGPEDDANLVAAYREARRQDGLPLLQLLEIQYEGPGETFYSYMDSGPGSVRLGERKPMGPMDVDSPDPLLQFYKAVEENRSLPKLVGFVDTCAMDSAQERQSAFASPAQQSNESNESNESQSDESQSDESQSNESQSNESQSNDPSYTPPRSNIRGGDDEEEEEEEDEEEEEEDEEEEEEEEEGRAADGGGSDGGDGGQGDVLGETVGTIVAAQQPTNSDARVSIPIRLREVEEADYYMKDALMSVEQAEWATEHVGSAHTFFIEHMSSRMGYGEVMLMQPPRLDPTTIAQKPTGGEIASSKRNAAQIWNALLADERTKELAQLLEDQLISDIVADLALTSDNAKQWRTTVSKKVRDGPGDSNDQIEFTHAQEGLQDHQGNIKLQNGYRQAMRLAASVNAFRNHEAGGLIALFAWWHRLNEDLNSERVPESARADRLIKPGQSLCERYSEVHSATGEWVNEKTKRLWRGMWTFMEKVDIWLDENAPDGMRERVNTLAADDAFAMATDWPALMANS
jgi:hypothetical protein